jgi:hypothetical protein
MSFVMVGPGVLADYLNREMMPDLSVAEIEADIRSNPEMYYIDYLTLCSDLHMSFFSEDGWADLCRS